MIVKVSMSSLKIIGFILLILCCLCQLDWNSDASSNLICKSVCDKLDLDGTEFADENEMSIDLINAALNSSSIADLFENYGYYSAQFKQKHLLTLQGFKQLKSYASALSAKYNQPFNLIVSSFHPEGVICDECDPAKLLTVRRPGLIAPNWARFQRDISTISTDKNKQLQRPLLDLPFNEIPRLQLRNASRLLQNNPKHVLDSWYHDLMSKVKPPSQHLCFSFMPSLVTQAYCLQNELVYNSVTMHEALPGSGSSPVVPVESHPLPFYPQDNTGIINLLIFGKYGSSLVDTVQNCRAFYYDESC